MKQKIEWYREVLEIEPNSKIFFPLARMLAKDDRVDEAITVLRQGVGRHPDHIEARLFLVELLYAANRPVELHQEIESLSALFKTYPGFWRAWGERLFADDTTRDAGLAAIFLAAFLRNSSVSWSGVIEQGLKGLIAGDVVASGPFAAETHPLAMPPKGDSSVLSRNTVVDAFPAAVPAKTSEAVPDSAPSVVAQNAQSEPVDAENGDEDEPDEPITLRTRSMADILAEQGDTHGALDIYSELLAASASDGERRELQERMNALTGSAVPQQQESEEPEQGEEGKNRLTDMLEALAQRLEAKSLQ